MINYDKTLIKQQLTIHDVFSLLEEFGGEPYFESEEVIISRTICHNPPADNGSFKLYYYDNNKLFHCYSGCADPSFDIFELIRKIFKIQFKQDFDLNQAVRWVVYRFGFVGVEELNTDKLEDWDRFDLYKTATVSSQLNKIKLQEYDEKILDRFNQRVKITPWLKEGINQAAIKRNHISYYPGDGQIVIPHYDVDGRLVGIRGRTLSAEDAELYGKYRPIRVNNKLFTHPLGLNLYNLNNSKVNIPIFKKAIVFESEKSTLMFQSYFGADCDITVATCGSNLSAQQVALLIAAGAEEIIIAFDRDFEVYQDDIYKMQVQKYKNLNKKYKNFCTMSFIFDTHNRLKPKQSPIDAGPDIFMQLFKERILLK